MHAYAQELLSDKVLFLCNVLQKPWLDIYSIDPMQNIYHIYIWTADFTQLQVAGHSFLSCHEVGGFWNDLQTM